MEDKEFAEMVKKSVQNINWCLSETKKRKMKIHIDFKNDIMCFYYRYLTQDDTLEIKNFFIPVPDIDFK